MTFEEKVERVRKVLEGYEQFSVDYHTEGDFASSIDYIVKECCHLWKDSIEQWLEKHYMGRDGHYDFDHKSAINYIYDQLDEWDCDPEYDPNEYSAYHGDGCCLYSFNIGECEEQISVMDDPVLKEYHYEGILDDILDELKHDFCIVRDRRWERNEETGLYEYVCRETYNLKPDWPHFYLYIIPGGNHHYVVSHERMVELFEEYIDDCTDN